MYPFSYTGLCLVHDEKVRNAMERARIDAELVRKSQRAVWLSLFNSVLKRIRSRLNVFAKPRSRMRPLASMQRSRSSSSAPRPSRLISNSPTSMQRP